MASRSDRPYDLVVFGATSFVGDILCRYLVRRHGTGGDLTWAIAGRSATKLEATANATGADVPRIVTDATDPEAVAALVDSTRLVISTVGPYALYGSELVAAAAAAGTDYVDLTGEPQWMQRMIDAHADAAAASGARIVHTCGFDSIPSDLGVWFTQQQAQARLGRHCTTIAMRVKAMKGGASGGTVASLINVVDETRADPELRKALGNPYALAPEGMRSGPRQPNVMKPTRDPASGEWIGPFVMAGINTKVVHRSHALLGRPWGDDFVYDEAMLMGEGPKGAAKASALVAGMGGFMGVASVGRARGLLNRVLPAPGEGPSPEAQAAGFFDIRFFGTTADGQSITTKVTGDRDPGYGSTAKMLAESATTLLQINRGAKQGTPGGFWTPATALGDRLIDALVDHAGLTFEVL
ncbi:MAG: saccharopine dehydrogenase NADP-binding domain-containing protein [Actinomycetota bacterium]